MVNFPPDYCPYCGEELVRVDPPTVYRCDAEDRWVFHNPTPSARVLVLDGDRLLLVRQGTGAVRGKWLTPGGKIEIGHTPAEHAAIELEEETNLRVDPAALALFHARAAEAPADHHIVSIIYAVRLDDTDGTIAAGSDADRARLWHPNALTTLDQFDETDVEHYLDLRTRAYRALESTDR